MFVVNHLKFLDQRRLEFSSFIQEEICWFRQTTADLFRLPAKRRWL
jgi:hypothetical protein